MVDTAAFERDVVRPQVTLFEYANLDPPLSCDSQGRCVYWPAVPEEEDRVDPEACQHFCEMLRPFIQVASEVGDVEVGGRQAKQPVTAVEVHFEDFRPNLVQVDGK